MDESDLKTVIKASFWGVIVCAFISMCTSCKQTEYVAVPEYHNVYVNKTDTLIKDNNIFLHDSIYVMKNGDTLTVEKWHTQYVDKLVYRNHIDTIVQRDSINTPVYIEKKNSKFHDFTYNIGLLAIGILILGIIVCILKKMFRF